MFIEEYVAMASGNLYKMGSKSKIIEGFSFFVHDLSAEDFYHKDPDTYMQGHIMVDNHKTVTFRSYVGSKGACIDLVCHGEFDQYSFWDYENIDDSGVQRLKNRFPGSAHVQLAGPARKVIEQLEEFISDLQKYESHRKKLRLRQRGKR